MIRYLIRRILYAVPILIGVNIITFFLFFVVNTPENMARMQLGMKHVTPEAVDAWLEERGYDKPMFFNGTKPGLTKFTETIFFENSIRLFTLDFGRSDAGRDIGRDIRERMVPSLAIAIPTFVLGLFVNICLALLLTYFRSTPIDSIGVLLSVGFMSISGLFYIIAGQFLFGKALMLVPISGYEDGSVAFKFLILPIIVSVFAGMGSGVRWYRSIFLEEINKDYVRTARAKGLPESVVMFKHVLRNGLIPILTGAVVIIPSLFLGSLILESFFGIPGLGSFTIDAINSQDFGIVRSMVFLGSVLYILGLILTDISYTLADPRVRL
jgi:peptide/nickel transport system permease protein